MRARCLWAPVEQVYGVRIKGNTTVGALVAQNDGYRVYVDAYLRGARVGVIVSGGNVDLPRYARFLAD
jgi:threonine dehydratase